MPDSNATPTPRGSLYYRCDPIATFLIEKLKLSPLGFALIAAAIATLLYLSTALLSGTLLSTPNQMGLLQDPIPWFLGLLISPVVLGYYLWSFQALHQVLSNLSASEVLEIYSAEVDQLVLNTYGNRWRQYLALFAAIVFSAFVYATRQGLTRSWTGSGFLPAIAITLATLAVVYLGSILILNFITNIWILHQILGNKELNVNPLHPDRCGGLRALSQYAIRTAYLAAVLGILVGLMEYQFIVQGVARMYWFVHLVIPLYALLSVTCFFGPLLAAHHGMKKAKEDLLHSIARQFQQDYDQLHTRLTGEAETLKQGTEKIRELRDFYSLTDEFPVWPFDVQTFRRYLFTAFTPLLTLALGIGQQFLRLFLKQFGIDLG